MKILVSVVRFRPRAPNQQPKKTRVVLSSYIYAEGCSNSLRLILFGFKNLKVDLAIRPIYHQKGPRVEAHSLIAFLAYCLHLTLAQQLRPHAPGLTPLSVLDKFAAVPMIDVAISTTGGRTIRPTHYTEPPPDLDLTVPR